MDKMLRIRVPAALAALLCGAIACGGSDTSTTQAPALKLATSATLGSYLVDGNGRSLYYFGKDLPASGTNAAVSNCSGGCAAALPHFLPRRSPLPGVSAGRAGAITPPGGSKHTSLHSWPP